MAGSRAADSARHQPVDSRALHSQLLVYDGTAAGHGLELGQGAMVHGAAGRQRPEGGRRCLAQKGACAARGAQQSFHDEGRRRVGERVPQLDRAVINKARCC
jgi:hypothetical protein